MPSSTLTVTNNHGSATIRRFRALMWRGFNHKALVDLKLSRADGHDIYLTHAETGANLIRPHIINPNTAKAVLFFPAVPSAGILPSGSTNYTLHYGYLDRPPWTGRDAHKIYRYSQWNPISSVAVHRTAQRVIRPFLWFDDFTVKEDTGNPGNLIPYSDNDDPDNNLYLTVSGGALGGANWNIPNGGQPVLEILVDSTSRKNKLIHGIVNATDVQVWVEMTVPSNVATLLVGGMWRDKDGDARLNGFSSGPGSGYGGYILGEWTNDVGTTLASSAVTSVENVRILCHGGAFGTALFAALDRIATLGASEEVYLTATSALHAADSNFGIFSDSTEVSGSPVIQVHSFFASPWGGIRDTAQIEFSWTAPTAPPDLPCPGFPEREVLAWPVAGNEYPEFVMTRRRNMAGTGTAGQKNVGRFDVNWPSLKPDEYWGIVAFYDFHRGGAGTFTYTPPDDPLGAGLFRIAPGSLVHEKGGFGKYRAAMSLERMLA